MKIVEGPSLCDFLMYTAKRRQMRLSSIVIAKLLGVHNTLGNCQTARNNWPTTVATGDGHP